MDRSGGLREALGQGRLIVVVGTGSTIATVTDPRYASWEGLLSGAVEHLATSKMVTDADAIKMMETQLRLGKDKANGHLWTSLGQQVVSFLGGNASATFNEFFRQTIGKLEAAPGRHELIAAINQLDSPILTTNYDTVIESVLRDGGRSGVSWRQDRAFLDALQGRSKSVAHLHGIWNDPESIILTATDYQRLLDSAFVGNVKNAISSLNTLLFVGFGAGLNDPTFDSMIKFLRETMPSSATHYRLGRESEMAELQQEHLGSNIVPISYGEDYSDLPIFLRALSPKIEPPANDPGPAPPSTDSGAPLAESGDSAENVAQLAQTMRQAILSTMFDESLIRNSNSVSEQELALDEISIEPPILPVPYELFVADQESDNPTLERVDPSSEALKDQVSVLVGDTLSGVSTTLRWMIVERSRKTGEIPVFLDVTSIHSIGPRPISHAVLKVLRAAGARIKDISSLPKGIILAVDNVGLGHRTKTESFLNDCINLSPSATVIGTHTGAENDVQAALATLGAPPTMMYTGRVNKRHAVEIARRVSRDNPERVAERALEIARRECLVRTPMSVTLLVVGLTQSQDWVNTSSNTSFIDSYIDSLLGRGDPAIDSRIQLDSEDFSRILQEIAKHMVENDCDSMNEEEFFEVLGALFTLLDWQEDAARVLLSLRAKGLLVERDRIIKFKSSVFLHIFGARRAEKDSGFLSHIRARPLRYLNIISHYAARKRDDKDLLIWAHGLLEEADSLATPATGIFGPREMASIEAEADRLESFAKALDLPAGNDADQQDEDDDEEEDAESFEPEVDRAPYPSSSIESASLRVRVTWLLSLASNIVRDSDLVEDPLLKQQALARVLRVWGHFIHLMGESKSMQLAIDSIVEHISSETRMTDRARSDFTEWMQEAWPLITGVSGIRDELLTGKLRKAADRVGGEDPVRDSEVHLSLMLCVLMFQLDNPRWTELGRALWTKHQDIRVVRTTLLIHCNIGYHRTSDEKQMGQLENLIIDIETYDMERTGKNAGGFREKRRAQLRTRHARVQSRRIRRAVAAVPSAAIETS